MKKTASFLFLFSLAALVASEPAQACTVCMGSAGENLQKAFFWGILLLLVMPFILFGIIGGKIFLSIRRKNHPSNVNGSNVS